MPPEGFPFSSPQFKSTFLPNDIAAQRWDDDWDQGNRDAGRADQTMSLSWSLPDTTGIKDLLKNYFGTYPTPLEDRYVEPKEGAGNSHFHIKYRNAMP